MTRLEEVRKRAELDASAHGYHLIPDAEFLSNLIEGLKRNEERYGYPACPCRMATGVFELDRDIICPCDYRDPDVREYGTCYCCLYVDEETYETGEINPIPERRPPEKQLKVLTSVDEAPEATVEAVQVEGSKLTDRKLFYCKVCGYICFRDEPPYVCPICRAKREFFAEAVTSLSFRTT
ncbi:MAG: ferredoxin-thioredoxin reductase catalytic domain-containing protein [Candidatus Bathyarchaeota archaeon]|jgi:ferredoxin-thioredoxin reductase catalytic subunit